VATGTGRYSYATNFLNLAIGNSCKWRTLSPAFL
jgi:hypothetical protein